MRSAAALGCVMLLAACGGDTTTTGPTATQGTINTVLLLDNPSSTTRTSPGGSGSRTYTGTITGTVQAQISNDGLTWTSLGDPQSVSIPLQSDIEADEVITNASVRVGTYSYVRLVFGGDSEVQAYGVIGGQSFSPTTFPFGSGGMIVQKTIHPLTVTGESTFSLVWDLNSELWLTAAAMQTRTISPSAVQDAAYAAALTM